MTGPGNTFTSRVGSPSANQAMAIFELQGDEALIIEMGTVPVGVWRDAAKLEAERRLFERYMNFFSVQPES